MPPLQIPAQDGIQLKQESLFSQNERRLPKAPSLFSVLSFHHSPVKLQFKSPVYQIDTSDSPALFQNAAWILQRSMGC